MKLSKQTAEKWYKKLGFPAEADAPFFEALDRAKLEGEMSLADYDLSCEDGEANLLHFLCFCEELEEAYNERNIPESILLDTLGDIVVWTKTWSGLKCGLFLGELEWLSRHLGMRLFKLGRLQFCLADSEFDILEKGLEKGASVIEVHIPEGEPLLYDECVKSLDASRKFFAEYFPEYDYSLFTCHSWLLDSSLKEFLPSDSNILKFASLFKIARNDPSDALLGYLFKWGIKREELVGCEPVSSLAKKVKASALDGRTFFESLGWIEK